ncbi:hypothetical protein Pve01_94570 [Planomonospora venezuelensis]|nr:hypothetical protein Pve01_94570 [Planomonospora venezuelensis]
MVPELLDDDAAYVTGELRDAPLDVRVELRRRVRAWVAEREKISADPVTPGNGPALSK